ncbi:hypothetical protein [Pontibacter sp. G13]|uniref:hypothetical protein n=1 Tax=Pontibacter sp. G13 TaxID=3074898 RepID=UPI00288951AB|nr:hypothetical protein [Pontibacter sp. G13]WNJ20052.1 hypothetical protein RJD25_06170 [Pontibacter sp. G13]
MNDLFEGIFSFWQTWVPPIADEMYEASVYTGMGIIWFCLCLGVPAAYYLAWNSSVFNKPRHWLILAIGTSFFAAICTYFYVHSTLVGLDLWYDDTSAAATIDLFLRMMLFTMIGFTAVSLIVKNFSINASRTPF